MSRKEVKWSKTTLTEMRNKRKATIQQMIEYERHCLEWAKSERAAFEAEIDLCLKRMAELEPRLGALKVSDFNASFDDDQLMVLLIWLCVGGPPLHTTPKEYAKLVHALLFFN